MTDFRAELQRLVEAYEEHGGKWPDHHEQALFQAAEDARTALAEPGPVVPTDEELWEAWGCFEHEPFSKEDTIMQLREFLARWGNYPVKPDSSPANQPDPVAPTDEELLASVRRFYGDQVASVRRFYGDQAAADMEAEDDLRTARAVLARWGQP